MKNAEIASIFEKIADIMEIKGENTFRINSYRKAGRVIRDLTRDIEDIANEGDLTSLPGIGKGTAEKIIEYLETGRMKKYEEVKAEISEETVALLHISGLGPKTVAMLNKELRIKGINDLEVAIAQNRLIGLPGMGEKKIENILKGINLYKTTKDRIELGTALPVVRRVLERMEDVPGVKAIQPAGSLRRMRENIGDIDILVSGSDGSAIIKAFVSMPEVTQVIASGDTKGSMRVEEGIQIDLRVVSDDSFGSALQYFTGSKAHNVHLRDIARKMGFKISEYGIFKGEKRVGGRLEEDIYSALNMNWIPPELREDRGEIEAATGDKLPKLIEISDIRGDLHVHSNWSDGTQTLEEIAIRAREMGYEYMVISDHSKSLKIANGLTEDRLLKQWEEIDRINKMPSGFRLLKASEVDIKQDGSMDFPDEILRQLDIVIGSIHTGFKQSADQITARIVAAANNPYVNIIGHPTGRLISSREGYSVNLEKVMDVCAQTNTSLEINAFYDRLDLNDISCRMAKEKGVKLVISTDTHHIDQFWMMELGVGTARRGWLEKRDVLNTMPLKDLLEFCKK